MQASSDRAEVIALVPLVEPCHRRTRIHAKHVVAEQNSRRESPRPPRASYSWRPTVVHVLLPIGKHYMLRHHHARPAKLLNTFAKMELAEGGAHGTRMSVAFTAASKRRGSPSAFFCGTKAPCGRSPFAPHSNSSPCDAEEPWPCRRRRSSVALRRRISNAPPSRFARQPIRRAPC